MCPFSLPITSLRTPYGLTPFGIGNTLTPTWLPMAKLPTNQSEIKPFIDKQRAKIKELNAKVEGRVALIKAAQSMCSHPSTHSGNTWGRWPYTKCDICGKEW